MPDVYSLQAHLIVVVGWNACLNRYCDSAKQPHHLLIRSVIRIVSMYLSLPCSEDPPLIRQSFIHLVLFSGKPSPVELSSPTRVEDFILNRTCELARGAGEKNLAEPPIP